MKIAVIGCGAIGGLMAAQLIQQGCQPLLAEKDEAHRQTINTKGLTVSGVRGNYQIEMSVGKFISEPADVFLIATKSYDTAEAVESIIPFLKENSLVVSLQNGIGNEETIAARVGWENTVAAVVGWGATHMAPGKLAYTSQSGNLEIGYYQPYPIDQRLKGLQKVLNQCEPTIISQKMQGFLWAKCIINSAINTLGGIHRKNLGEMVKDPKIVDQIFQIVHEGIAVANAKKVKLEKVNGLNLNWLDVQSSSSGLKKKFANFILNIAAKKHGAIKSSLWQDLEKGQPTEIKYLNGAIVREGRLEGVTVSYNGKIIQELVLLEKPSQEILKEAVQVI